MHTYGGSIVAMTSPKNELLNLEMSLRGYAIIDDQQVRVGSPLLNSEGVNTVMGMVRSSINRITIMSNLKKEEVNMLIMYMLDYLARTLMMNKYYFQIKRSSDRDNIVFLCVNTAYICMKRAQDEGDRRFWKGSQQDIRTEVVNSQSKSFLSALNPFKQR